MVHTTRHHDYDHDVDIDTDASDDSELELKLELEQPSTPAAQKAPRRKRKSAIGDQPAPHNSRLPSVLQFPLLVLANMLLSAGLYSAVAPFTAGDLATVSRTTTGWAEIASLIAFRTFELALGWWGQFDGYDLASLTLLTHTPYLFLLTAFYSILPSTLLASLLIDVTSILIPTQLLRPLSAAHTPSVSAPGRLANRSILSDLPIQLYVSSLGSAVYALTLSSALTLGLPAFLIARFDAISSTELAHSPYLLPVLLLAFLPLGAAAHLFVFAPSTAAKRDRKEARDESFDPVTAGLAETVVWNLWGFTRRTRVAIVRTAFVAVLTAVNTWLQVVAHIAGTEPVGAAVWAAVWSAAAVGTGAVFWWVADVNEVKAE